MEHFVASGGNGRGSGIGSLNHVSSFLDFDLWLGIVDFDVL